jgi:FixJ family two-component response regulator
LLKVIAMSGGGRVGALSYLELAEKLGAIATLEKPFNQALLIKTVDMVLNA